MRREWYPGELEVWRRLPDISTSEFAARYRIVTVGAHQGKWDNSITPYLTEIMDTADLPWVRRIVICGPEQSGKTNACLNIHLKNIVYEGGNAKFVMFPSEHMTRTVAATRLIPIYRECAPVAAKLSTNPDDVTPGRIVFRDGTIVFPAWATSASKLSSFPADFTWGDEVDKNPDLTGDESDSLRLLEKRTRTFRRSLNLVCSTPTLETGHIWRSLTDCVDIRDYHVECPTCGKTQIMQPERIVWPGQPGLPLEGGAPPDQPDADPRVIEMDGLARYRCEGCGVLWDDLDRNRAVRRGRWVSRAQVDRPPSVGFHISGLICPDISLSSIAARIIVARSGDVAAERERDNSFLGVPWKPAVTGMLEEETVLRYRSETARNLVPDGTAAIWLIVDTQATHFYYQVWAAGYGSPAPLHMMRHGVVETFADLEGLLATEWRDAAGKEYRISSGLIDSGGGRSGDHSRTVEVYDWCSRHRIMNPLKGIAGRNGEPITYKTVQTYPGTNRPVPGGLVRLNVRVDFFKDELSRLLAREPDDPGALSFHCEIDRQFARHYTTETRDDHGDWVHDKNRGRNDHWDCTVYCLVQRERLKLRWPASPDDGQRQMIRTKSKWVHGWRGV